MSLFSVFSTICHRDPVESVRQIKLGAEGPEGSKRTASATIKRHQGIEGLTLSELSAKWHGVVTALERTGVTVTNPDHALEGALSIRYFSPHASCFDTLLKYLSGWLAASTSDVL